MKTAKVPPAEASSSSSSRKQPVRQTRTNPPRANPRLNPLASHNALSGANAAEQPINIFPGITHFADAITALPKELVRHFTLLKEVDAKIFAPEAGLFEMVDQALQYPPTSPPSTLEPTQSQERDASSSITGNSGTTIAQNISTVAQPASSVPDVFNQNNLPRRQLFRQTALRLSEMILSLDEKNHVISTANDALQRHLGRIDDIWPHLENEFSDEAKWGSDSHWAYPENRAARALNSVAERTRREGAASLSAAAHVIDAGDAAARSDARKQAVAAKKSQKNQHQDSDRDDHEGKGKETATKKQPAKRKPAAAKAAAGESPASVGLGISGQPEATITPAPKRRKVEKQPANGTTPTPAMSAVFSNAKESKVKASASPRATPNPEQPAPKKQRKALPNSNGQAKKRVGPAASPSVNSSPVVGHFPDSVKPPRASPAPSVSGRPASSRARQSSIASNVDKPRPLPAAASKSNGVVPPPLEIPPNNSGRGPSETPKITQMEPPSATTKVDPSRPQNERAPTPSSATTAAPKKDSSVKSTEDDARQDHTPTATPTTTVQQVTTTKSGRASKPSTPAIGSFPDGPPTINNGRARPARNSEAPTVPKRSHKKGASQAHAAAMQKLAQQKANGGSGEVTTNNGPEDDMDVDDPDEPTYCYCNRVSFGEMVGCDGGECKREWFHLECVGLRNAPPKNSKWFCDDCKKMLNNTAKKVNGR